MDGLKIVLSGTDSFGFKIAADRSLIERCEMMHTTWMPFREYSSIVGTKCLDDYLMHGGILVKDDVEFSIDSYVFSAIADNIQNALDNYRDGRWYNILVRLRVDEKLTSAIHYVVQHQLHWINTSHHIGDRMAFGELWSQIEEKAKEFLRAREIVLSPEVREKILYYLVAIDFLLPLNQERNVIAQPAIRFNQTLAALNLAREAYSSTKVYETIEKDVLSQALDLMMEDYILTDAIKTLSSDEYSVSYYLGDEGEVDLLIYNKNQKNLDLFEIKHAKSQKKEQAKWLLNTEFNTFLQTIYPETNFRSRNVIYTGETKGTDYGINYINGDDFLLKLEEYEVYMENEVLDVSSKA